MTADYVSDRTTRALLHRGRAAQVARLDAGDMLSTDEAAARIGINAASIEALIANGNCIGLMHSDGGFRLPSWQFEPNFLPVVPKLAKALATAEGWALLAFLESPQGVLDGATPRVAIERGETERVLEIAGWEA